MRYRQRPGLLTRQVDDELVIVDMDEGQFYGLSGTGATLWKALERPLQLEELVRVMTGRFTTTADECRDDTQRFLELLKGKQLVVEVQI